MAAAGIVPVCRRWRVARVGSGEKPETREQGPGCHRSLGSPAGLRGTPVADQAGSIEMPLNRVDQIKGYFTPDLIQKAAAYTGESESATHQAIGAIVPTLVAALANQASTPTGAQQLASMLDTGKYDGSALSSLAGLFSGGVATQNAI